MTTYNTGNAVGSSDPRDLYDNAQNLDRAINDQAAEWTDRLGKKRPTIAGAIDPTGLAQSAATSADRSESARDAAFVNANVYSDVASGLAAVADGEQFQVADDLYITRYLNSAGTAEEVARYPSAAVDSLTVNSSKAFPLNPIIRDGTVSSPGYFNYNDFLLDVKVIAPEHVVKDYYFRISYFQNEQAVSGVVANGIELAVSQRSVYETQTESTVIHTLSNSPLGYTRGTGVQSVWLKAERNLLTPGDIWFQFTIDTNKLPGAGSYIRSRAPSDSSGSWIIDTSCYEVAPLSEKGAIEINGYSHYPLRQMNVGGIVSPANHEFSKLILDAEVLGAENGKLYAIHYYQNGLNDGHGWILTEFEEAGLETNPVAARIENRNKEHEVFRDNGIQTLRITPTLRPGITFKITIDPSALPEYGTFVRSSDTSDPGYSWVVDPSCYVYPSDIPTAYQRGSGVEWSVLGGDLTVAYKDGQQYYRITFGPNGFNNLPNFKRSEVSADGAAWTLLEEPTTDWLPPIMFQAVNDTEPNPDGTVYTGGNHGSDGGAGGLQTARNVYYSIAPDGVKVSEDSDGLASAVVMTIVNEVMAHNTITLGRYPLIETFKLIFRAGGVDVTCRREFREEVALAIDNGLQATTGVYRPGTFLVLGSAYPRQAFTIENKDAFIDDINTNPGTWATILFRDNNPWMFAAWMDKGFGALDGNRFNAERTVRFGSGGNHKLYHVIFGPNAVSLPAGGIYEWRGGYLWGEPPTDPTFDSVFHRWVGGEMEATIAIDNANWWNI